VVSFNRLSNEYKIRPAAMSLSKPATIHPRLLEALCNRGYLHAVFFLLVTATVLSMKAREARAEWTPSEKVRVFA